MTAILDHVVGITLLDGYITGVDQVFLYCTGAPKDNVDGSLANTSIGSDSRSNVAKVGADGSVVDVTDGGTGNISIRQSKFSL